MFAAFHQRWLARYGCFAHPLFGGLVHQVDDALERG
jgi:hypothetical protein